MHKIKTVPVGLLGTNCYLVQNPETKETLIFDPGADAASIRAELQEMDGKPAAILLTHGHFDHIGAVKELVKTYAVPVIASALEKPLLQDIDQVLASFSRSKGMQENLMIEPDRFAEDGEVLEYAGFYITCLSTPGHTAGGMSYFFPTESILISGDTLFMESVGRTDFPSGDEKTLLASIRDKLYQLPDETIVLPGHGPATNIAYEKRYNIYTRSR